MGNRVPRQRRKPGRRRQRHVRADARNAAAELLHGLEWGSVTIDEPDALDDMRAVFRKALGQVHIGARAWMGTAPYTPFLYTDAVDVELDPPKVVPKDNAEQGYSDDPGVGVGTLSKPMPD